MLQTIWRTISLHRIGSKQKRRYQTISQPTRPIFKTGEEKHARDRDYAYTKSQYMKTLIGSAVENAEDILILTRFKNKFHTKEEIYEKNAQK